MHYTERACTLEDYDFVFGIVETTLFPIIAKWFPPRKEIFDQKFKETYQEIVIVTVGEKDAGFYQLKEHTDHLEIVKLFLDVPFQGKGLGRQLMQDFECKGFDTLVLEVWENNPALHFYEKLGYERVKIKDHKYTMKKHL